MMYGLAVLLALTGAAHADSARYPPPPQYDHPFAGKVLEITANTMAEMAVLCAPHPRAGRLFGCRPHGLPEHCHIIIAPVDYLNIYGITAEQVRRHEMAHCNGWPANHPRPNPSPWTIEGIPRPTPEQMFNFNLWNQRPR